MNYIKNKSNAISNHVLIDLNIADSLVKKDELTTALKIYKKILSKDFEFFPALQGCADRLYNLDRFGEANDYLVKMYKLNPFISDNFLLSAHSLINNKEYEKAKTVLEYALLIRDDKAFYFLLKECYKNLGNITTSEIIKNKMSLSAENINLPEVQEFLMDLYNKNTFYRKLFVYSYKILKKISKK